MEFMSFRVRKLKVRHYSPPNLEFQGVVEGRTLDLLVLAVSVTGSNGDRNY